MALMESRKGSVDAVNFSCQRLKTLVHEKDDRLRLYQAKMRTLESFFLKKLKTIKVEKEYIQTFKDKCVYKVLICRQRQERLRKELIRISGHNAHYVDSTMWTEGVVQRVVTKPFRKHLVKELRLEKAMEAALMKELEGHRESILECSIRMEKTKREGDKITIGLKIIKKTYDAATKYSMAEVTLLEYILLHIPVAPMQTPYNDPYANPLHPSQSSALGDETVAATTGRSGGSRCFQEAQGRGGTSAPCYRTSLPRHLINFYYHTLLTPIIVLSIQYQAIYLQSSGARSLADKARMKQYENRNKEERQFIALDLVMRPEEYENVPLMEAEQMHFDEVCMTTCTL